jgi:hypothetical protein
MRPPSPATLISITALVLAAGGTGMAAGSALIGGEEVRDGSLTGRDIAPRSLPGSVIQDDTITAGKLAPALRARINAASIATRTPDQGPRGQTGDTGATGTPGAAGAQGPAGLPGDAVRFAAYKSGSTPIPNSGEWILIRELRFTPQPDTAYLPIETGGEPAGFYDGAGCSAETRMLLNGRPMPGGMMGPYPAGSDRVVLRAEARRSVECTPSVDFTYTSGVIGFRLP